MRTEKITPELVNGFADGSCALGRPAPFAVVTTPFGQIGLLPGEDILYSPYARALVLHGAELALPPATALHTPAGISIGARGAEDFIYLGLDLQTLRRARANPFVNLALWDDPAVYAVSTRATSACRTICGRANRR